MDIFSSFGWKIFKLWIIVYLIVDMKDEDLIFNFFYLFFLLEMIIRIKVDYVLGNGY